MIIEYSNNYFCVIEVKQLPSNCCPQCYQHNLSVNSSIRHILFPVIPIPTKGISLLSQWTPRSESHCLRFSIPKHSQDSISFSEKTAHKLLSVYIYLKTSVYFQETMEGKHNYIPKYTDTDLEFSKFHTFR